MDFEKYILFSCLSSQNQRFVYISRRQPPIPALPMWMFVFSIIKLSDIWMMKKQNIQKCIIKPVQKISSRQNNRKAGQNDYSGGKKGFSHDNEMDRRTQEISGIRTNRREAARRHRICRQHACSDPGFLLANMAGLQSKNPRQAEDRIVFFRLPLASAGGSERKPDSLRSADDL